MRNNHTPGPWQVLKRGYNQYAVDKFPATSPLVGSDAPICVMIADEREDANAKENARLIAAAPDMYEAIREALVTFQCNPDWRDEDKAMNMMRDAIKKAEGKI